MNYIAFLAFVDVVLLIMILMLETRQYSPTKVFVYGIFVITIASYGSWVVPCATAAAVAL